MLWIAMRVDLAGDPSTLTIADELDIPIEHVIGLLHKFWCWADSQLTDGNAPTVTETKIDRFMGVTGFTKAIESAGWLVRNGHGITIPNFDNWMSKSAKTRLKGQQRVNKHRSKACNAPTVTKALPQYSTVQKRTESLSTKTTSLKDAEKLYAAYPLKKGKKAAIKAITKALKEKTAEELMAGVTKYAMETKGSEFIKHPATWFNQGCWDDETTPPLQIAKPPGRVQSRPGKYAGR